MEGAKQIIQNIKSGKISSSYSHSNKFPNVNCSGLVNNLLVRQHLAAPLQEVQDYIASQNNIQKPNFLDPTPSDYVSFFSMIGPLQHWRRVYAPKEELQEGDIVAYTSDVNMDLSSERGQHMMIVADKVKLDLNSSIVWVPIFDSTKIPHGESDLRNNGNGIGQGIIGLEIDAKGSPTRIQWSLESKSKLPRNIKMARVLE